jgi:DNA helicase II / ATP-dependent DNA helicase PcrA
MVSLDEFYGSVAALRGHPTDSEQQKAIDAIPDAALMIVAGPGTGKTTCLTLRILKLVLVDGIPPRGVLATTFTKKAAQELRSRVLGWGFQLIDRLKTDASIATAVKRRLEDVDINQVWTGTLDSLCEQLLRDYRAPGTQPPILADEYVSKTLLLRHGLFNGRRDKDDDLHAHLLQLHSEGGNAFGYHIGTKVGILKSIWDRRNMDQLDWPAYVAKGPKATEKGRKVLDAALKDFETELASRGMVDFALLESEVLLRLRKKQLTEFTTDLRVVLVDEYQDTNLLQEEIYFELASACNGALCVVGDDDQSLYRFRGATVDLFSRFAERYIGRFKRAPASIYLSINYRSTKAIVQVVNDYATMDTGYQVVRVAGKPKLAPSKAAQPGRSVLGMFRDDLDTLSTDLADFVHAVFRRKGFSQKGIELIVRDPERGNVGDCGLLCSSPAEYSAANRPRLPLLLRNALSAKTPPIEVFNPRGQDIAGLNIVSLFGGLLAECIDPGGALQGSTSGLLQEAVDVLSGWRTAAVNFATSKDAPNGLLEYAQGWVDREPKRSGYVWPRSVSIIELIYGLVHFFPELHDDSEGQIYLEVFTRQLGACEQVGKFKGRLVHDPSNKDLSDASVKELLRDFLGPIASGTVQVDEELIEAFPRDRLSVLSIHQSKGLEFPITIVDVGSDFKTNHHAHAFKRHPTAGGPPHRMENEFRAFSPLGKETRLPIDRAFDDLFRQYFVAFSRPQEVLLLVGLRATFPGGRVPNVATGWDRKGVCHWEGTNLPFMEI